MAVPFQPAETEPYRGPDRCREEEPSRREKIATAVFLSLIAKDFDGSTADAARLAVEAADALLRELSRPARQKGVA